VLQDAVSKYEVVLQNLDFARDLHKQFQLMLQEVLTFLAVGTAGHSAYLLLIYLLLFIPTHQRHLGEAYAHIQRQFILEDG